VVDFYIKLKLILRIITYLAVVSKHFIVDVALGRVGVATEGRTSQLGGSDGTLRDCGTIFGLGGL
jgi:hypothetical protein